MTQHCQSHVQTPLISSVQILTSGLAKSKPLGAHLPDGVLQKAWPLHCSQMCQMMERITPLLLLLMENLFQFPSLLGKISSHTSDHRSFPLFSSLLPALVRQGLLYSWDFLLWIHLLVNISKQSGDR